MAAARRAPPNFFSKLCGPTAAPAPIRRTIVGLFGIDRVGGFGAAHATLLASILRACRVRSCAQEPLDGRISFASVKAGRDNKYKAEVRILGLLVHSRS